MATMGPTASRKGTPFLVRTPRPGPSEDEIQRVMGFIRKERQAQFTSNLDVGRMVYHRFPELVTAESVDLPREFIEAYQGEYSSDPFEDTGFPGDNVFASDFEEQVHREALEYFASRQKAPAARQPA